jgi:hypothetical protein
MANNRLPSCSISFIYFKQSTPATQNGFILGTSYLNQIASGRIDAIQIACIKPSVLVNGPSEPCQKSFTNYRCLKGTAASVIGEEFLTLYGR